MRDTSARKLPQGSARDTGLRPAARPVRTPCTAFIAPLSSRRQMDWFLLGGGAGLLAEVAEDAFSAPADLAGVGRQRPGMMRMAVVLPAPLGPTNPNSWPSATVHDRSSRATKSL